MNWDDMRVFLAVARTQRLSSAARKLGVQHSTVGRRVAALEANLGVTLFYRGPGGYRLTRNGERILGQAEAMERAALLVGPSAREGADTISGRVRVALLEEFASHWLVPALPELRRLHPAIEVQVVTGIAPLNLSRGEADLAVRTPRPRQPGLVTARLARTEVGLYASAELVRRDRLDIHDVDSAADHPLAIYVPEHQFLQSAAWFAPVIETANVVLTSNSTHSLLAAARSGVAVAVLPRFVARQYPELVPVSENLATGTHWLTMQADFRRDPKVRAVADFLRSAAAALD